MAGRSKRKKKLGCRTPIMICLVCIMAVCAWILWQEGSCALWNQPGSGETDPVPRNTYSMEGFFESNGRISYEDETRYTVTGIDVSVYQGEIDWQMVAEDGISFAVIQAGHRGYSDGELEEDLQYRANLAGAKEAGLEVGVYFFSQAVSVAEAREEAMYLLTLLDDVELDLPVFYDWERAETGRTWDVSGETVTQCAAAFCEIIVANGYDAGIYFNQDDIYSLVELEQLLEYPLWFAQYQSLPDFIYDFTWWQYTDQGTVNGIHHPVDLNLWMKSK